MDEIQARVVEVDGVVRVLSPAVGVWSGIPGEGALVGAVGSIGALRRLHRTFVIRLPRGIAGRVVGTDGLSHRVAVGYGDELFRIEPIGEGARSERTSNGLSGSDGSLSEGEHAIVAPTDGIYYSRPTPDAAPFVTVGCRLHRGQPVGLVEVMKTFNQILYDGDGLSEEVEVVDIRVADGDEIEAGSVLIVVKAV